VGLGPHHPDGGTDRCRLLLALALRLTGPRGASTFPLPNVNPYSEAYCP
jgi:hypothetical protein